MRAPKMSIFETAANLELWPKILPHYRYIRYLERDPNRNVVVMAARRSGIPIKWTSEEIIDRDVRMRRAAENLHCQRRLNSARTFFQKANVLLFRFANSAESGPETHADPVLWFVVRIFDSRVVECELGRRDRELGVTIEPFQTVRGEKFFGVPIIDLAGDADTEAAHIETGNRSDSGFLRENSFPETFNASADASDRAETGDNNTPPAHAVTLFARVST